MSPSTNSRSLRVLILSCRSCEWLLYCTLLAFRKKISNEESALPRQFFWQELRKQLVVVRLQLFQIGLGVPFGIKIVRIEFLHPWQHCAVFLVLQMLVGAMAMPRIEGVEAQHVESFVRQVRLHDFGDVPIVAE